MRGRSAVRSCRWVCSPSHPPLGAQLHHVAAPPQREQRRATGPSFSTARAVDGKHRGTLLVASFSPISIMGFILRSSSRKLRMGFSELTCSPGMTREGLSARWVLPRPYVLPDAIGASPQLV